jgi:hypothetical protein
MRASDNGSAARFSVIDTGIGISADEFPRLFERFRRIEGARGRSFEGSGIGLALVQELVKLHGGDISVESQPGVGSTFTVAIPFGTAHLPDHGGHSISEAADREPAVASTNARPQAYINEALGWSRHERLLRGVDARDCGQRRTRTRDVQRSTLSRGAGR